MSDATKALVQRHFEETFNRPDYAAGAETVADDFTEHAVALFGQAEPGRVNGPQHIRRTAEWLLAQFPDLHMRVDTIITEGDLVACRVYSERTNVGRLNGVMAPTGRRFAGWQCHWFRVAHGKLVEHRAVREDLPLMLQLGVLQPPGSGPR